MPTKNFLYRTDLIDFKPYATAIKTGILPICSYIKVDFFTDHAIITKNGLNSFVTKRIQGGGTGSFLIDERILFNFIENEKYSDVITISAGDNVVILKNGSVIESHTDNPALYPEFSMASSESVAFSKYFIDELLTASKIIVDEEETPTPRSYVFVGNGYIAASDGFIGYFVTSDHPKKHYFKKEVLTALVKIGECNHAESENYDFFSTDAVVMGFVKPSYAFRDMTPFITASRQKWFQTRRNVLMDFNSMAMGSSKKEFLQCVMAPSKSLHLRSEDKENKVFVQKTIDMGADYYNDFANEPAAPTFTYTAQYFNKLLKVLPAEDIIVYSSSKERIYLSDHANTYLALLMGVVPNPVQ